MEKIHTTPRNWPRPNNRVRVVQIRVVVPHTPASDVPNAAPHTPLPALRNTAVARIIADGVAGETPRETNNSRACRH